MFIWCVRTHTHTHAHTHKYKHGYFSTTVLHYKDYHTHMKWYFPAALNGTNVTLVIQFEAEYFGEGGFEDTLNNIEMAVS